MSEEKKKRHPVIHQSSKTLGTRTWELFADTGYTDQYTKAVEVHVSTTRGQIVTFSEQEWYDFQAKVKEQINILHIMAGRPVEQVKP